MPYPAVSVRAKGDLEADKSTLMLFDQGTALAGLQYSVTSLSDSPSEQVLNSAAAPSATIGKELPTGARRLRPALRAGRDGRQQRRAKTSFEKAVALQNWLADGTFKYTLKAPAVLNASGLTTFLERTKSGDCQQFSFAMAVLARLLGIPSRIAYGFTSGTRTGNSGQWLVTTHDAHAWPELYFQGLGWLRFEPTPSGADGQGTAYAPYYTYLPGTHPRQRHPPEPTSAPTSAAGGKGSQNNLPPTCAPRSTGATSARTPARPPAARGPRGKTRGRCSAWCWRPWSSSGWRRRGRRGR